MRYRLLAPSEWDRLDTIMPAGYVPRHESASCAIAEDDSGAIVGVLFIQLTLHMEPLVLTSPRVSFKSLYDVLYNALGDQHGLHFYCFSDKEIVSQMAELVGLKPLPFKVYEGEVK